MVLVAPRTSVMERCDRLGEDWGMRMQFGHAATLGIMCAGACLWSAGAAEIAPGIKLSADLRIRSENLFRNDAFVVTGDVLHARLRLRLGLGVEVDERWDLGLRLSTGGSPTSANQDLDALGLGGIRLFVERAFARFHTGEERAFELYVGRMPNPYVHSMMLWDSDFNPDGLAEKCRWEGASADSFLNLGQHVLGQVSLTDRNFGPSVYVIQPGLRFKRDSGTLEVAAAYYRFAKADGVQDVPAGSDYAIADIYASWEVEAAGGRSWSLWIDGFFNTEAPDHRTAWGIGVDIGSTKRRGSARVGFSYMSIDKNALWINLGDADFSTGLTDEDMHGFVLEAAVAVAEKATLGATWYFKDSRDTRAHEDRLDIDLILKF
jgi:hypothetical protein